MSWSKPVEQAYLNETISDFWLASTGQMHVHDMRCWPRFREHSSSRLRLGDLEFAILVKGRTSRGGDEMTRAGLNWPVEHIRVGRGW